MQRLSTAVVALLILLASAGCYSGESGDRIRVHVVGDTGTTITVVVLILIFVTVLWIGISIHARVRETRDVMKNIRDTSPAWREYLSEKYALERDRQRQEEEEITKLSN